MTSVFSRDIFRIRVAGSEIRVGGCWVVFSLLLSFALSSMIFPYYYKGLHRDFYFWLGISGSVGFFLSVLIHELFHILGAKSLFLPVRTLKLHLLGGINLREQKKFSVPGEIFVAFCGPVGSFVMAFVFHQILILGKEVSFPAELMGLVDFLRVANLFLGIFHLLPAYPLDGGRIVRALVFRMTPNLSVITPVLCSLGAVFGLLLISGGVMLFSTGVPVGGIWWMISGFFLKEASGLSSQKYMTRKALEGQRVSRFMTPCPVSIAWYKSLAGFEREYLYKYHYRIFPVVDGSNRLMGELDSRDVMGVTQRERRSLKAKDLMRPVGKENSVREDSDIVKLLSLMESNGRSRMMVTDKEGRLAGVIVLKDLLRFFLVRL
jgi:Zn-dependent protease